MALSKTAKVSKVPLWSDYSIRGYLQFSIAGLPLVRASQLIGKMYGVRGFEILL